MLLKLKKKQKKLLILDNLLLGIHFIILSYIFIIIFLSLFGVLNNYPLWNKLNFIGIVIMVLLQIYYSLLCPITVWQNKIRKKLNKEKMESFVQFIMAKIFKLRLSRKLTKIIGTASTSIIIFSYLFFH